MAYSHQEFYKDEFINEKKIEDRINNKKDLFDRKINYEKVLIDNSFPEYVFNNKSMFKDWII